MRFIKNQWFKQIYTKFLTLLIIFVQNTYSAINVSQTEPISAVGTHNHITATNERPFIYSFCGEPPNVSNALSNLMRNQKHNVFKVGEIAIYSCDIGFKRTAGKEESQCMAGDGVGAPRWQPIDLICEPVKCDDPGFIENGSRKVMQDFLYNTNVQYECYSEFRMIGVPFLTCKFDGKWNRQKPKCQRKQCPDLPNPLNGRISYSDSERRTDSKMEYLCNPGFKLSVESSLAVRYCRQDDSWSQTQGMNYSAIECSVVKCETPIRPHSGIRIVPSRPKSGNFFKPGDVIIYSCDTNSRIKASTKCLSEGQWSRGPPHCPERTTTCPTVGVFLNGYYNVSNSAVKDVKSLKEHKVNTKLNFYCNESYILDGPQSLFCLSTGVWNATTPECIVNSALQESQSSQLTILITSIAILVVIVFVISCVLVCRWRQQQLQRRRWQQYFGHYNHRQSKTNIMLNQNEMKCFRQTPPKPTVPVTDL